MNNAHESSAASAPESTPQSPPASAPRRRRLSRRARSGALAVAALAVLTAVFYLEENWRGGSAWQSVKENLKGQQEKLDWADYVPPAVPDGENFYKAPKMQEWFVGQGTNELTERLSLRSFPALTAWRANSNTTVVVAELMLRPPGSGGEASGAAAPPAEVLPLVALDKELLSDAIGQLARLAKLKVTVEGQVDRRTGPDGKPGPLIRVTGQWTNVSALSALMAVLYQQNLCWVEDAATGQAHIQAAAGGAAGGGGAPANRDLVLGLIRAAIGPVGEIAEGVALSGQALAEEAPRRLSIAPDSVPTRDELARVYARSNALAVLASGASLNIVLTHAPVAAGDYLAWSGQFAPEFDKIREAVKRPSARLDGDYGQFYQVPAPNLTALHAAALRLAGRAQAFVMRGEPEQAMGELTLLHGLRASLENRPTGKPMTLAAALADVAIAGAQVETIDYGLRLQVWRDAELAGLEDQLSRLDLVSPVWSALESARAGNGRLLEGGSRGAAIRVLGIGEGKTNLWQKISSPAGMVARLMPRGWLYRNLANGAMLDQKWIDAIDRTQGTIRPHLVEAASAEVVTELQSHHRSFYWFVAKDLTRQAGAALQATARTQCAVNQALLVCALERCRLARGEYPAALGELMPQFIAVLPLDPVNGEAFKYRSNGPGRFVLYSIGWDEKDDHGAPSDAEGKGDWVWGRL